MLRAKLNTAVIPQGTERESVNAKAGEAGVVGASEGVPAAAAGWGRGGSAAEAEAVLWGAVSPVQEEDAAVTPQPGAGSAQRGTVLSPLKHINIIFILILFYNIYKC